MGRSVSTPSGTDWVLYLHPDIEDEWQFRDFIEDIRETLKADHPELENCEEWPGREDHAILESGDCYIGVSEYCGLVALWGLPKEPDQDYEPECPLEAVAEEALHWSRIQAIEASARKYWGEGSLRKIGTFSNGEAVFEKV